MSHRNTIALCLAAYLVVFFQARWQGGARVLGARVDLLPSLVVCGAIISSLSGITITAVFAGLAFDSFSQNPIGISILPLFCCALVIYLNREFILRGEYFAQFVLGTLASLAAPVGTALTLFALGHQPIWGWSTIITLIWSALLAGAFTPVWFYLFQKWNDALHHPLMAESSFNPDRQIDRGRF